MKSENLLENGNQYRIVSSSIENHAYIIKYEGGHLSAPREGGNLAIRTGNHLIFLATWGIKLKLSQKLEKIRHRRSWVQE